MKKTKRIIICVIMLLMVISVNVKSYATSLEKIQKNAEEFISTGETQSEKINVNGNESIEEAIAKEVVPIVGILTTIGILVIGMCMVILGIQWVSAQPSPEAQAKLKAKFVSLAISAGIIFGAYTIWSVIVTIMDNID